MKILITGAAGFIGAHLAKEMIDENIEVALIDRFSDYYAPEFKLERVRNLINVDQSNIHRVDLSSFVETRQILLNVKPDAIIHLAAQPGIRLPREQNYRYLFDNMDGFTNILNAALDASVDTVLYASSSSIYDDSGDEPFSEKVTRPNPKSFYGLTKLWNEQIAQLYANQYGMKVRGMRFFTVYGPWGRPDMAYFRIVSACLGQYKFKLFGDGSIKRDFTFVSDVTSRIRNLLPDLMARSAGFSDVVNIGGGTPYSILDLINEVQSRTGNEIEISRLKTNPLDLRLTVADKTYGSSIFKTESFVNLRDGVDRVVSWAENANIRDRLLGWIKSTI